MHFPREDMALYAQRKTVLAVGVWSRTGSRAGAPAHKKAFLGLKKTVLAVTRVGAGGWSRAGSRAGAPARRKVFLVQKKTVLAGGRSGAVPGAGRELRRAEKFF